MVVQGRGGSLTCLANCAWQWKAGTLGTAIHRPVSHRAPASGRTGGRLCYTHHTGSACHPHLGEGNLLVTSATASLNVKSRSCYSAGGQDKARERCKELPGGREPSFSLPLPQWKPAALKNKQATQCKVQCPAKISCEGKGRSLPNRFHPC